MGKKIHVHNDSYTFDIDDDMRELLNIIEQIKSCKASLVKDMKEVDREITDIEHAAEFYNLNAAQGYKVYKLLHDARERRRIVKDRLSMVERILETKVCNLSTTKIDNKVEKMNNRNYCPRVLKELFNM